MEQSIQRQRKALKYSIQQYVATDEKTALIREQAKRISLARNLTERKNRNRKLKNSKTNASNLMMSGMPVHDQQEQMSQVHESMPPLTELSVKNYSELPQWKDPAPSQSAMMHNENDDNSMID